MNIFNNKCFMGKHTPNSANCTHDEFIAILYIHIHALKIESLHIYMIVQYYYAWLSTLFLACIIYVRRYNTCTYACTIGTYVHSGKNSMGIK